MMLRRLGCTALVGGASILSFPRNAHPQVNATVDLGASAVRYDGFLPSSAAALTPTFTWDGARGGLTIRGTYLRFESGNRSLQGSVGASVLTQPVGSWRGELSASAGASSYAGFPSFWHALGDVRLHHDSDRRGLVIDATAGRSSFGKTQSARPVAAVSIATWLRRDQVAVLASVHRAFVGDTQYSDIDLTVRVQRATLSLETSVGARFWSRGAGRGVYGEGSGTLALSKRIAFVLSAGRYPTDPIRGSIAGRYAAASLRVRLHSLPPRDPPRLVNRIGASGDPPAPVELAVRPERDGQVRLIVQVSAADRVEIAGDFTQWQPVSLLPTAGGAWEALLVIPRGVHRINVRVSGGAWLAPFGITRVHDDYGGEVGVFLVP